MAIPFDDEVHMTAERPGPLLSEAVLEELEISALAEIEGIRGRCLALQRILAGFDRQGVPGVERLVTQLDRLRLGRLDTYEKQLHARREGLWTEDAATDRIAALGDMNRELARVIVGLKALEGELTAVRELLETRVDHAIVIDLDALVTRPELSSLETPPPRVVPADDDDPATTKPSMPAVGRRRGAARRAPSREASPTSTQPYGFPALEKKKK